MAYGSVLTDVVQSSVTGTPPQFNDGAGTQTGTLCRAWVNYNASAQTIGASFNVSSVTYTNTGRFTINMTNALTDTKYAVSVCAQISEGSQASFQDTTQVTRTTSAFGISTLSAGSYANSVNASVAVFR